MSANVAVVMESAEAAAVTYPKQHYQGSWVRFADDAWYVSVRASNGQAPECGTTLCWAAWIAFQQAPEGAYLTAANVHYADGTRETIAEFAARAASLTDGQAGAMFLAAQDSEVWPMALAIRDNPDISGTDLLLLARAASGSLLDVPEEEHLESLYTRMTDTLHGLARI